MVFAGNVDNSLNSRRTHLLTCLAAKDALGGEYLIHSQSVVLAGVFDELGDDIFHWNPCHAVEVILLKCQPVLPTQERPGVEVSRHGVAESSITVENEALQLLQKIKIQIRVISHK